MKCSHYAMVPAWYMGGIVYTCQTCGISVDLNQWDLGRMVKRRLKKRGMLTVNVEEYPVEQSEQGAGERPGDESGEEGAGQEPES